MPVKKVAADLSAIDGFSEDSGDSCTFLGDEVLKRMLKTPPKPTLGPNKGKKRNDRTSSPQ